ncbi:cobyric acid synthase CobQ [Janibacter hoylei PVAS-1]|uniref:Cobyric acid synthase CobQ n=1 Tax=Janibacter hoylei PVAS-1 TaxID=1210046 RepID=K1ETQ0_9MICO|nr:cobyric acid synthase CobQ [Janibacter hoylei PVAS-1]
MTRDIPILGEPTGSALPADPGHEGKGEIHLVHLYPREMSIYGDLGNTRCLAARIRRHGYVPVVHQHHPGQELPEQVHLVVGGGGQGLGAVQGRGRPRAPGGPAARPRGRRHPDAHDLRHVPALRQGLRHRAGGAAAGPGHPRRDHPGQRKADDRPDRAEHRPRRRRRLRKPLGLHHARGGAGPLRPGAARHGQQRHRRHRGRGHRARHRLLPARPDPAGQPAARRHPHRVGGGAGDRAGLRAGAARRRGRAPGAHPSGASPRRLTDRAAPLSCPLRPARRWWRAA